MNWQKITVNDTNGKTFLISISNESDDNFLFKLTDFQELWREKIHWNDILCRAKVSERLFTDWVGIVGMLKAFVAYPS